MHHCGCGPYLAGEGSEEEALGSWNRLSRSVINSLVAARAILNAKLLFVSGDGLCRACEREGEKGAGG